MLVQDKAIEHAQIQLLTLHYYTYQAFPCDNQPSKVYTALNWSMLDTEHSLKGITKNGELRNPENIEEVLFALAGNNGNQSLSQHKRTTELC